MAAVPINVGSLNPENALIGIHYIYNGTVYLYTGNGKYIEVNGTLGTVTTKNWQTELYYQGLEAQANGTDPGYYFAELSAEWPRICDVQTDEIYEEYLIDPSALPYFLDFIDTDAAVGEFNVKSMGRRTKATNGKDINCLFEPSFKDIVIIQSGMSNTQALIDECLSKGQSYVLVGSSIYGELAVGSNYNSAYNEIRNQIFQSTSYNESITIQAMPIYYLEPNTRITVVDPASGIGGDYIIKSISLPLTVNGTMSLSCTRALQRI